MRVLASGLLLVITIAVSMLLVGVYASPERVLVRIQGKGRDFPEQVWGQPMIVPEFSFVVVSGQPKEGVLQCTPEVKEGQKTIILRCEDGVVLRLEGISWR